MLKDELINCGAVLFGEFTLTSGAKSSYYVDIKKASTNPGVLKKVAKEMAAHVDGIDMIAGMELGAVPIAVAVALETGKPYVIIRKGERTHGTGKQIEGDPVAGKRVLIVEDVTTSGGSTIKSVEILRDAGASVDKALVVVDREAGAIPKLADMGVNLIPMVTVKELLKGRS